MVYNDENETETQLGIFEARVEGLLSNICCLGNRNEREENARVREVLENTLTRLFGAAPKTLETENDLVHAKYQGKKLTHKEFKRIIEKAEAGAAKLSTENVEPLTPTHRKSGDGEHFDLELDEKPTDGRKGFEVE